MEVPPPRVAVEERRRKRPWRKPREAVGPGTIPPPSPPSTDSSSPTPHGSPPPPPRTRTEQHVQSGDEAQPRKEKRKFQFVNSNSSSGGCATQSQATGNSSRGAEVEEVRHTSSPSVPGPVAADSQLQAQASCPPPPPPGLPGRARPRPVGSDASYERRVPVDVDGSVMEGGGQILRNAMAMSCLLGKPIDVSKIRAGRGKPGLRPQHLTGIQLLSRMCDGKLDGCGVGSSDISFQPSSIKGGSFTADTATAGSICLILQAALPCMLFAPSPSHLELKGGTNADMAPPIDYMLSVFKPIAEKFGMKFECSLQRRGFFPKGGGLVVVDTSPVKNLTSVVMTEKGEVTRVKLTAYVAGSMPPKLLKQMTRAAKQCLEPKLPSGIAISCEEVRETRDSAFGNGSGIMAVAETTTGCVFGGSANGRRGTSAEEMGTLAAEELLRSVETGDWCVDEHMQDQLVILMALAKGRSEVKTGPLTEHTKTAIHIMELLSTVKFTIQQEGDTNLIVCEGLGLQNKS